MSRRSIRSFNDKPVGQAELDAIVQAGLYAPSAMNRQPAIMVVLQNKQAIRAAEELNARILGGANATPFYGAGTVILVFSNREVHSAVEDASLCLGNLMNAAHAVGVSSCWIHRIKQSFELEEGVALCKQWGVPENYMGVGACILGYTDQAQPAPAPRAEHRVLYVK